MAGQGTTKHFSRGGAFINQFPSHLPGGCRKQSNWKKTQALLDTIYVASTRTYYVLDVMVWNDHAFYDCDTTFRYILCLKTFSRFSKAISYNIIFPVKL